MVKSHHIPVIIIVVVIYLVDSSISRYIDPIRPEQKIFPFVFSIALVNRFTMKIILMKITTYNPAAIFIAPRNLLVEL